MGALTVAEGGARFLSFVFYVLAARTLTTAGFGVLRYTTTLAALAFFAGQVLVTALMRELGVARRDPQVTAEVLGSALVAAVAVVTVPGAIVIVVIALGSTGSASAAGLAFALVGLAGFQLYYAIGRGLGRLRHALAAYLGGSLAQLVVFAALALTTTPGPLAALAVFGLSSLVPIVVLESWRPLVRGRPLAVDRRVLLRLWRIGAPLLVAELCWLTWLSIDQVWVAARLGTHDVGLYGAAKTLAQLFAVLPAAVAGILLPRVAELRAIGEVARARSLIRSATIGVLAASALIGVVVVALRGGLLATLYGESYRPAAPALVGLTAAMTLASGFIALTASAVAWGRPRVYTLGAAAAAVTEVAVLLAVQGRGITTAAWATAASISVGLAVVLVRLRSQPLD
jgi:O-antigen/teichoic acid export membrane protein